MTQLTEMPNTVDSSDQQKTLPRGSRAMTTAAGSHAVEARSRLHALGVTTVVAGILGAGPAIASGPLVAGRIAIGVWILMFVALGASLVRADPGRSR